MRNYPGFTGVLLRNIIAPCYFEEVEAGGNRVMQAITEQNLNTGDHLVKGIVTNNLIEYSNPIVEYAWKKTFEIINEY